MTLHKLLSAAVLAALAVLGWSGCLLPEKLTECSRDETCRDDYGPTYFCADDGICEKQPVDEYLAPPCDFDYAGPVFHKDTYNLGVILALNRDAEYWGLIEPIANAIRLAQDDINSIGGVDGHDIGLIFCNTDGKNDKARAAARHLADIGVEAVVGPDFSSYAVEVVPDVLVPNEILSVTPSATTPALSGLNDDNLAWRTVPSDRIQTRALANLVQNLAESSERRDGQPAKIAMLTREQDSYAEGLQSGVINAWPESFVERIDSFRYPNAGRDQGNDYTTIASKVADEKPDIVLVWGLTEVWDIVRSVDSFLQRDHQIDDTIYVVADGGKDTAKADETARKFADDLRSLEHRVWGTAPRSLRADNYDPYKFFKFRWKDRYGGDADTHPFVANAYDAVYLIALAAAVSDSFDGPALADGMSQLTVPGADEIVGNQTDFSRRSSHPLERRSHRFPGGDRAHRAFPSWPSWRAPRPSLSLTPTETDSPGATRSKPSRPTAKNRRNSPSTSTKPGTPSKPRNTNGRWSSSNAPTNSIRPRTSCSTSDWSTRRWAGWPRL